MTETTKIKARPTTYTGIKMRSRLEADFAAWLDGHGIEWEYETQCYAGPAGQWLPDFTMPDPGDGIKRLIEIKPDTFGDPARSEIENVDDVLTRMSTAWLSEPDALLILIFWDYGTVLDGKYNCIIGQRQHWSWVGCEGKRELGRLPWPGMGQLEQAVLAEMAMDGEVP